MTLASISYRKPPQEKTLFKDIKTRMSRNTLLVNLCCFIQESCQILNLLGDSFGFSCLTILVEEYILLPILTYICIYIYKIQIMNICFKYTYLKPVP